MDWLWGCVPYVVSIKCSLRNKFGCNTTSMRSSVSSPDETLRRELKMRREGVSSRDETLLLMLEILLNKYSLHRGLRSSDDDPSPNTKPVIGKDLVFSVDFGITRKRSLHPQKQKRKQTNKQQQPQNCHGPFARLFSCGF